MDPRLDLRRNAGTPHVGWLIGWLGLGAAAVLSGALPAAADAAAANPPSVREVLFISNADGDHEIYSVQVDAPTPRRLTDNQADDLHPRWSPDGQRIAFISNRDGNAELYLMAADGSEQGRLTRTPGLEAEPRWSPDGSAIAYLASVDGRTELWRIGADGTGARQLTRSPLGVGPAAWSPDGHWLAYPRKTPKGSEVWLVRTRPGSPGPDAEADHRRLTSDPKLLLADLNWSADGRRLLASTFKSDRYALAWIDVDTGVVEPLHEPAGRIDAEPRLAADGRALLFLSDRGDGLRRQLYLMSLDGSEPRALTTPGLEVLSPSFGPEVRDIAYSQFRDRHFKAFYLPAPDAEPIALSGDVGEQLAAQIRPTTPPDRQAAQAGAGARRLAGTPHPRQTRE